MLLSKAVAALLIDFVAAQDLSNEYASQISRKYKQYRDSRDNILNNFDAPASVLKEIELDLKFSIVDLNEVMSYGLDVEETWGNCRELAGEVIDNSIPLIKAEIDTVISELRPSPPESPRVGSSQPLVRSAPVESSQEDPITQLEDIWIEVRQNLSTNKFTDTAKRKIYQKLFKVGKSSFLRGRENLDVYDVRGIVRDKLQEAVFEHPDFQEAIRRSQETLNQANVQESERIYHNFRDRFRYLFSQIAEQTINEGQVRGLIQKLPEITPQADVMVTPDFLRELPIETLSSLKVTVEMEGYQWTITETSESLSKAKGRR